ncbi:hypothetical protein [Fibrella forsythiae]|uniref:Lipoprotein n=1 Tax=Fibrella forsythiae TaxID=2817061 RepID=A0ABS3JBD1_9BACT|nr:hypothetical protein [Fibrella forsythiae]MBO0947295.1 hypothetical protein [Fibrella forsythiae]
MKSIFFLLALTALVTACEPSRPDCTLQETAGGGLVPFGDCDNCDAYAIINSDGGQRPMTTADAERYVQQNPPSVNYNPAAPTMSDFMLYHMLMTGPRASHYSVIYAPQVRSYSTYRRTHPGYTMPRRYVSNMTVINKTVVNRQPYRRSVTSSPSRSYGMSGGATRTFNASRTSTMTSSRPSSWGSSRSSGFSSSRYSSPSRSSSFRSSSSSSRSSSFGSSRRR